MKRLRPVDVPSGYSPNLQNVRFLPRAVLSRAGLTDRIPRPEVPAGFIKFNTLFNFNGAAQFINNSSVKTVILLDSNGVVWQTNQLGVAPSQLGGSANAFNPNCLLKVQQSFGREFMAAFTGPPNVSEPLAPGGPIRHWDGNVDAAPTNIPAAPTVTNGSLIAGGSITAGVHTVAVVFEMQYGMLSPIGMQVDFTAPGGAKATVSNVPLGPVGCVARRIIMTTVTDIVNQGTFYWLPAWKINDNSTTTIVIDGSDTLLQGNSSSVPPVAGQGYPIQYSVNGPTGIPPTLPPLSPDGPGEAPLVSDDTTVYPSFAITNASEFGNVATITTGSPHGYLVGQTVIILGVGVAGYNVTTTIGSVPTPTTFTYFPGVSGLSSSGGGTAQLTGSVSIGVRQIQVVWETRWGYLTGPSPTVSYTASGGLGMLVTNIPIGPWYVIARRILVTLSGGADFFYITQNRIGDNTTTSTRLDFTDIILAAGSNFDYLARNFSPMDSYGVGVYGGHLTTWGGLNTLKGVNFGFDGGWDFTFGVPAGWTAATTPGNNESVIGGFREVNDVFCGEAWRMTGVVGGVPNVTGLIGNASIQPLLQPSTPYTISIRAKWNAARLGGIVPGNKSLNVLLFSPSSIPSAILGPGINVVISGTQSNYIEIQGVLTQGISSIPQDTYLLVNSTNLTTGDNVYIDHIRVWPTNQKYESSVVRISNALDPETFDGVNGFVQISKDDGQFVTACVQLRSFYYVFKERSMSTTYDDGTNPPSLWFTRSVDNTIGSGNPNSVVSSDTFITTFWRSGAYLYSGGRPIKISQEIQPTWLSINWDMAWTNHILLDTQNKLTYFFCPIGSNVAPFNALILDYSEGIGTEDDPAGRKWGLDVYSKAINGSFKYETSQDTQSVFYVIDDIYENVGADDAGTAIDSFYETAFVKAGDHGQDVFMGCSYFAEGSGQLFVSLRGLDDVTIDILNKNIVLSAAPGQQFEMYGNLETERAHLRFETSADKSNFTIKGATLYAQPNFFDQRPQ